MGRSAQGLSAAHLAELVRELEPLVQGARVVEVVGLPPADLLFILEPPESEPGQRRVRRLRLSANRESGRVHLQIGPVARHQGPPGPFFRAVARELEGARLRALVQVAGDRLLRLDLLDADGRPRALVAELIGRHANLLLLDGGGRIEELLVEPGQGSRAAERLARGGPWTSPGGGRPAGDAGQAPSIVETFPDPPTPPAHAVPLAQLAPLSWRIEASIGASASGQLEDRARRDLRGRLERRLRSARDQVRGLAKRSEASEQAERVRMDAELLTAHLGQIPRGQREVTLPDAFDPEAPPRTIALDPGLSPRRNAERLFARAKKMQRVRERLPAEIELARAQVSGLERLLERAADEEEDPASLEAEALQGGWLPARQAPPQKRRKDEPRRSYHRFTGCRGSEIRVGRSARDNDTLTFKDSRGNDLWLHTSDCPGSHVVLVLARGAEPDPEEVIDAAHLAIHFSPRKDAGRADVHVARRKEVSKPRRAPAGLVTLSGGKTRRIRIEPQRLERLLATRGKVRPGTLPGSPEGPEDVEGKRGTRAP